MYVDRIKYAYIRVFSTVTWPIYNAYGPTSRPMHFIFCRRARDYDFFMHVRAQMHVVSCVLCALYFVIRTPTTVPRIGVDNAWSPIMHDHG